MAPIKSSSVEEFQGIYGPFTLAERVLQRIWLHGDFARTGVRLADGRPLEILSPGEWNLLGGPDFRDARLKIDGRELNGDVEVHFHASDWGAHGHGANPAYGRVVLHVVLFPPGRGEAPAGRADGASLPVMVLLPLLHRDLEEYAADDALERLTARDDWRQFAELSTRPVSELRGMLEAQARTRWEQKIGYARKRLEQLGWIDSAHHAAMEILGYRRNRAPMLEVAARYPLAAWREQLETAGIFERGRGRWSLHGVRPANHPLARLRQYQLWVRANPAWPEDWRTFAAGLQVAAASGESTKSARVALQMPQVRDRLNHDLCGGVMGGTRFDTLVCDGLLPLAAAETGRDLFAHWFHWYLGDMPDAVRCALNRLGVADGRDQPLGQGFGQGLLGWLLAQESRASP